MYVAQRNVICSYNPTKVNS
uniref:Uncharacterized protein n=1 Tax=Anguilla anguilla TaxID=7936 RepID=A0A0E9S845_ANGAN